MRQSRIYIVALVMAFLLASLVLAETDPLKYEYLNLRTEITGQVEILPLETDYFVNEVVVNLSWVPDVTYRQEIIHIETEPSASIGKTIDYVWKTPTSRRLDFKAIIGTKNSNIFQKVYEKKSFPLEDISSEYYPYLKATNISDITPEIKNLASDLVDGEDDTYEAVVKLAIWIEDNIEYDLSDITATASQKSSWVLANKRGVCDEITSLFISLCRAVGIPAKFSSGVAYTNVGEAANDWGPHGWAEVYFPDVGWVPFDVTYKQLGYVDATHIKLNDNVDASGSSMRFSANGKNINIESDGITSKTSIIGQGNMLEPLILLSAEIYKNKVGFGSYNMVTVTAKNNQNFYVPITLKLGAPKEIDVVGKDEKTTLLKPFEEKKIYFIIKVDSSLNDNYKYTFPIVIQERRKGSADVSFEADANTGIFELEFFESLISSENEELAKPYSASVTLNCTPDQESFYIGETLKIYCTAYNKGQKILPYTSICYGKECHNDRITAYGNLSANFTKNFQTVGIKNLEFTAQNADFYKTAFVLVNVMDKPLLSIKNLTYPEKLGFEELGSVQFILSRDSEYAPKKATITVKHDLFEKEWALDRIEKSNVFELEFYGKNLKHKDNLFEITVDYEDYQGNSYSTNKDFEIEITTQGFWQKLLLMLNTWEMKLENLFS